MMLQIANVKKDAAQKPAQQPMPKDQTRPLVLRIETLEERVAPVMFNPREY
jgi:hypothetical protein